MKYLNLFNSFMKGMSSGVKDVGSQVDRIVDGLEHRIAKRGNKIKRAIFSSVLQFIFVLLSVAFLATGIILFMGRFFSFDMIFLVVGALFLYGAFMLGLMR